MDVRTIDRLAVDGALFANRDWTVTAEGLEHGGTGYFIARDQVGRRHADGAWAWAEHMLEKDWVAPDLFEDAFRTAARLFGIEADDALALSFGAAAPAGEVVELRPVAEVSPRIRRAGGMRSVPANAARGGGRMAAAARVRRHG
jgi:hypothetical protein